MKSILSIFKKFWWSWVALMLVVSALGFVGLNYTSAQDLLHDSKKIEHLKPNTPFLVTPNTTEVENETENSAVAEYQSFLSILSLLISVAVAWVAYTQLKNIAFQSSAEVKQSKKQADKAEAEFLIHLDKEWCSTEITNVRSELWGKYKKSQDKHRKNKFSEDQIKALSSMDVQNYIVHVDEEAVLNPEAPDEMLDGKESKIEHLFRLLNFVELLGTIYILRKKEFIDDPLLKNIFGGRLLTYLEFYQEYFKQHTPSTLNAQKLLEHMKDLEKKT